MTSPTWRRIDRPDEEGACETCGQPLEVGDDALDVDDGIALACSRRCASRYELRAERRWRAELEPHPDLFAGGKDTPLFGGT